VRPYDASSEANNSSPDQVTSACEKRRLQVCASDKVGRRLGVRGRGREARCGSPEKKKKRKEKRLDVGAKQQPPVASFGKHRDFPITRKSEVDGQGASHTGQFD